MKVFLLILLYILQMAVWADTVEVEFSPRQIIKNEQFNIIFKINTQSSEQPYISFDSGPLEILGRQNQGVSIQTTMINGKFSTKRTLTFAYQAIAERAGRVYLRNINVTIGGKTIKVPTKNIEILSAARKPKNIFLLPVVSKKEVYVGEGLDVDFYLYFRGGQMGYEHVRFPKFSNFIKRFHDVKNNVENVQYGGEVYKRALIYSARLYPEKSGKAKIGSLNLKVQFQSFDRRYGTFGLGFGRMKVKSVSSKPVKIVVKPLPTQNVPEGFTGLVGDHQFKLSIPKNRYLANEAIELRLTVEGPGALENYDAPTFYRNKEIEEFDTKNEFTKMGKQKAKKVFDYTYLGRGSFNSPQKKIKLAYFDASTGQYVSKELTLPELVVSGTSAIANGSARDEIKQNSEVNKVDPSDVKQKDRQKSPVKLLAPIFSVSPISWLKIHWIKAVNTILAFIIVFLCLNIIRTGRHSSSKLRKVAKACTRIKKNGARYSDLFLILSSLLPKKDFHKEISIPELVKSSGLSTDAKSYFLDILSSCEKSTFADSQPATKFIYNDKYFKELQKMIPRDDVTDGNYSKDYRHTS